MTPVTSPFGGVYSPPKVALAQVSAPMLMDRCRLGSIRNAELAQDILHVRFRRAFRDEEPIGDLGVGQTMGQQVQDLLFPTGQGGGPEFIDRS